MIRDPYGWRLAPRLGKQQLGCRPYLQGSNLSVLVCLQAWKPLIKWRPCLTASPTTRAPACCACCGPISRETLSPSRCSAAPSCRSDMLHPCQVWRALSLHGKIGKQWRIPCCPRAVRELSRAEPSMAQWHLWFIMRPTLPADLSMHVLTEQVPPSTYAWLAQNAKEHHRTSDTSLSAEEKTQPAANRVAYLHGSAFS